MKPEILQKLPLFLETLGADEEPMGIFYTKRLSADGIYPPANFFAADELSFTVPYAMFEQMIERYETSFLKEKNWMLVQKKIERSRKAWER